MADIQTIALWGSAAIEFGAAVIILRAQKRVSALAKKVIDQQKSPRCAQSVYPRHPYLRCARHRGHSGEHMVSPAELMRAGYVKPPF